MRIIAGRLKGRRLAGPDGPGLRPTSDRLRETLFNILSPRIDGARVVDGFAGTGAIGLEALSRGAGHVTFVEQDARALTVLGRNIAHCGVARACTVLKGDFGRAVSRLPVGGFDLVVIDPPYDIADLSAVILRASPLVAAGGLLVLEHSGRRDTPTAVAGLERRRVLTAGDSSLAFYAPVAPPAAVAASNGIN